jgi:ATP-dependent helicase/nuclease subunit B
MVEAPDRRGEVDAAARRIRDLLRQGRRLRQIAVLVRDIDDYHELINASFREHDIPFFVDRRRSASHHPLIQFTRAVFQIARAGWPHEAMMMLIKSGLAGLSLDEAERLENYVLTHRLRGVLAWTAPEPWAYRRDLTRGRDDDDRADVAQDDESAAMDALRREVVEKLEPFVAHLRSSETQPIDATVKKLFDLYAAFGVRETSSAASTSRRGRSW